MKEETKESGKQKQEALAVDPNYAYALTSKGFALSILNMTNEANSRQESSSITNLTGK